MVIQKRGSAIFGTRATEYAIRLLCQLGPRRNSICLEARHLVKL